MEKQTLRKLGLQARNLLSEPEVSTKSRLIFDRVYKHKPDIITSREVLAYYSFQNEVCTHGFIKKQIEFAGSILLPRIQGKTLSIHRVHSMSEGKTNSWGIWEPDIQSAIPLEEYKKIEFALIPGVLFDVKMNRIGFGKGFYDRLLKNLAPVCQKWGISFDCQIHKEINPESHDIQMDAIFTESGILTGNLPSPPFSFHS